MADTSGLSPADIAARLDAYRGLPYSDYAGRAAFYAEDAVCFDPVGQLAALARDPHPA